MEVLKVSSKSNPNSVAGAIASIIKKDELVEIQSIGAAAVNQAVKAVAIARGFLTSTGKELSITPYFVDVEIESFTKTAIKMIVKLI
jgi:stage V sporulation protein S